MFPFHKPQKQYFAENTSSPLYQASECNSPFENVVKAALCAQHKNLHSCLITQGCLWTSGNMVRVTLAWAAQGGSGVSSLRDTQSLPGHGPGPPPLDGQAGAGGWTRWPPEIPSNLNHTLEREETVALAPTAFVNQLQKIIVHCIWNFSRVLKCRSSQELMISIYCLPEKSPEVDYLGTGRGGQIPGWILYLVTDCGSWQPSILYNTTPADFAGTLWEKEIFQFHSTKIPSQLSFTCAQHPKLPGYQLARLWTGLCGVCREIVLP